MKSTSTKTGKNILKGIYDPNRENIQLLVNESARLGHYRKSGDALVGRYFSYQSFPWGFPRRRPVFLGIER